MEINRTQNISFSAFYRNSPPCMSYLAKNFDGNKVKFSKALEILDERCSKHKFFDMFFSPQNNSIKILPRDKYVENIIPISERFINVSEKEQYLEKPCINLSASLPLEANRSFIKKIFDFFSYKRVKQSINPYEKLPSNVREAVDIIEKMEHKILW